LAIYDADVVAEKSPDLENRSIFQSSSPDAIRFHHVNGSPIANHCAGGAASP
jgi:hypothetical protein